MRGHIAMDQSQKDALVEEFFSNTGASYNAIVNTFTFGIDSLWKKKIAGKISAPKRILDLACGTGLLTFLLAKQFPKSEIVAVDIASGYLEVAWRNAFSQQIKNVSFVLGRAEEFKTTESFDVVTASYLPKYANLNQLIPNLSEIMSPNGLLLLHDFTYPRKPILRALFEGYFKLVPTISGWWHPEWRPILKKLPHLIREATWVADLVKILPQHRFHKITIEPLTLEGSTLVTARKMS